MPKTPKNRRKGGKGWWLIGGVSAIAILAVVIAVSARSGSATTYVGPQAVGGSEDPLDFPVTLYQGSEILGAHSLRFSSLLGDKPIVLNYWASNCAPCTAEMPGFEEVWQQYKDRVLFFGLDVGGFAGFGGPEESKKELQALGITYPAAQAPDFNVIMRLQVKALPSTDFIGADGTIKRSWTGAIGPADLTDLVEDLLQVS